MKPTGADEADRLLSERELAQMLGVEPRTLSKWRVTGAGPAFEKLTPRCIRYSLSAVREWRAAAARRSTSDPGEGSR